MSTPDRLGIALFEVRGRTLPPEMAAPSPRLTVTCHGCRGQLAGIYACTVGTLLLLDRPRARRQSGPDGALLRTNAVSAAMLDEVGDDLELWCQKCTCWRSMPDQSTLAQLISAKSRARRVVLQ